MLQLGAYDRRPRPKRRKTQLAILGALMLVLPAVAGAATNGEEFASEAFTMREIAAQVGADILWSEGLTGQGVDVAVIDSGVSPVPGLDGENKIYYGPDLSFEAGIEELYGRDTYGHGTVMASIIAGDDGTPDGYKGIAPGARIVALKVADNTGAVDVSQVIAALDWVVEFGRSDGLNIRVINLAYRTDSLQSADIDPLVHAVERAWKAGYVVVVSAGNDGKRAAKLGNPAQSPYVISVASSTEATKDLAVSTFSSTGNKDRSPDITAPGDRVLGLGDPDSRLVQEYPSAFLADRFMRGSGTSQSASVVSGAAALLLEARPELTPDQVKALLMLGADTGEHGDRSVLEQTKVKEPLKKLSELDKKVAKAAENLAEAEAKLADLITAADDDGDEKKIDEATKKVEERKEDLQEELDKREAESTELNLRLVEELEKLVSNWTGTKIGNIKLDRQSGAGWLNVSRSNSLPTFAAEQTHALSTGTGSLEASRGTDHVTLPNGLPMAGEVTFAGSAWLGSSWLGSSWSGSSWSGSSWSGSSWSGSSWSGSSWSGSSWSGSSWSGSSWSGSSWSGSSWSGSSWSGSSWSGSSWSGSSWSGSSWSGSSWSGSSWSGSSWS